MKLMQKMMLLTAVTVAMLAACGNTSDSSSADNEQAPVTQTAEESSSASTTKSEDAQSEADEKQEESTTSDSKDSSASEKEAVADTSSEEEKTTKEETKETATTEEEEVETVSGETATETVKADLTKPLSLNEDATDDSIVIYDMNDEQFITTRVDYSYAAEGSQTKKILMTLYDRYYTTYFNNYAVSKDEKKIILDFNGQGMLENNFVYTNENYVEIITSLFANFPKLETIQFKVDGQVTELDNFTETSRADWKKMLEQNDYTYNVVEN
ncbi:hypothetical protein [Kurthia sp. Dielmo]|uniref:hypothetical protein n=1 Tax=Kurthia sp. Dielmo TaxID=1033738 RepID=UPI00111DE540|nr:hypothetical protein [Kurthia sp. Dielmo]